MADTIASRERECKTL
jgi:hypothetical protein